MKLQTDFQPSSFQIFQIISLYLKVWEKQQQCILTITTSVRDSQQGSPTHSRLHADFSGIVLQGR